ncbi:MAG: hypothetical protein ACRDX9_08790 [Acidimicrobiia bacterium]
MGARLIGTLGLSLLIAVALVVSSGVASRLGVPQQWPWLLTGLQVLSLWAAGRRRWWGWLLGAAVQPAWIAYAILTGQLGFIPGCAVSAVVQIYSFVRTHRASGKERSPVDVSASGASRSVPRMRRSAGLVIQPSPTYVSDQHLRTYTMSPGLSPT